MAKIVSVTGGRPQFIKEAVMGMSLRKKHEEILVHTGQHYDIEMSHNLFVQLKILQPKYHLESGGLSHAKQTAAVMMGVEEILQKEKPDLTLVYGDMNSTMGACIASAKLNIPVAHVEAGARTCVFDMPEEQNRIVADHLSKWNFASNKNDYDHLVKEGITEGIYLTGDVMFDAFKHFRRRMMEQELKDYWSRLEFLSINLPTPPEAWYFATIHRPENTDDSRKLLNILQALNELPEKAVMPIHPRIYHSIMKLKQSFTFNNIIFTKPAGYLESLFFTCNASGIVTDSGGLQKEAYWAKVPCTVILRGIDNEEMLLGNCLVKAKPEKNDILEKVLDTERNRTMYCFDAYGDGNACEKITDILYEAMT